MEASFRAPILPISSLLLGIAFLVLGNSLQETLLSIRAGLKGMAEESFGLLMSAYFIGYASGSLFVLKLIYQFGHFRVFAALASLTSAISLKHLLLVSPWTWTLFFRRARLCYIGLVLVVESWLMPRRRSSAAACRRSTASSFFSARA